MAVVGDYLRDTCIRNISDFLADCNAVFERCDDNESVTAKLFLFSCFCRFNELRVGRCDRALAENGADYYCIELSYLSAALSSGGQRIAVSFVLD